MMRVIIVSVVLLCLVGTAQAAIEERQFDDPVIQDRYHALIAELRCLVCQNQNLADSNAELARDLRDKTAEMLLAGKSNSEILTYMSDRYGDFVLYRPPFRADTALLWLGPLALLLFVIVALLRNIIQRQRGSANAVDEISDSQLKQARDLLEQSPKLD